jgi:branched-chain amino acid transport system ATP-binding protein
MNRVSSPAPVLEIAGATCRFGGLTAVDRVTFGVNAGTIFGVIGPNGAGKTTLFNVITGLQPITEGAVRYDGRDITREPPHRRTALRMSRTFQIVRLFRGLSILENVMVGHHPKFTPGFMTSLLRLRRTLADEKRARALALELLGFVGLAHLADRAPAELPHGQQRLIEIARAMASDPRFLLLDEPAAGLNPRETEKLARLIQEINRTDVTVLLVEHDMPFVMGLCQRIVVLDHGAMIAEGEPSQIQRDPRVISAYLGRGYAHATH